MDWRRVFSNGKAVKAAIRQEWIGPVRNGCNGADGNGESSNGRDLP